jgi:hypothetical protein
MDTTNRRGANRGRTTSRRAPAWRHAFGAARGAGFALLVGGLLIACADPGPTGLVAPAEPRQIINGVDDHSREAVAAIMIYSPGAFQGDWFPSCSGTLIHPRVISTVGHCVQGLQARLESGNVQAVWVSFQQDPTAHFNADPALEDPAAGGWYEIESLHNNPDNPSFADLTQLDPIWGDFHDSGAIVLKERVKHITPMKLPSRPGAVDGMIARAGCEEGDPGCTLLALGFGIQEFPPQTFPLRLVRRSVQVRYKALQSLFLVTFSDPPGSDTGGVCFGDSGGPVVFEKRNEKERTVLAMIAFWEDASAPRCTNADIHYRADTESHLTFVNGIIRSLERRSQGSQ